MRIGLVPIDNRPVCYTLPKLISELDSSLELFLPERSLLGDLEKSADFEAILSWVKTLKNIDALVLSLDTVAYGGLIPSRRCTESFDEILTRLNRLKPILKGKKVYAFSSIMRISNNNINQEEKLYWDKWGKKIFEYSWNLDKNNLTDTEIPPEILSDYLATRERNFKVNKIYLEWAKEGYFDTLIFSKDDCAEYGLNVQEARVLKSLGAIVKTGADEIPLSLLARAIEGNVNISTKFLAPDYTDLISNYEDISIEECVKNQIELAGCEVATSGDVTLFVNNFEAVQGEIVMKIPTKPFLGNWVKPEGFFAIADVRFANGSDNAFVKTLFDAGIDDNFLGYSAWNTSANTLGSLIFALKLTIIAKRNGTFRQDVFNKLVLTRFLDDWAYQANIRQQLEVPDVKKLTELMENYLKSLLENFPVECKMTYGFPWKRLFEVEIDFT